MAGQNIYRAAAPQAAPQPNNIYALPNGPQPYQPSESAMTLGAVARAYPGMSRYLGNTKVQWGKSSGPGDDRQLEYYPPWEGDNPNPGQNTVELYNRDLKGDDQRDAVALDMLHYAGAVDPRTKQPVDPEYYGLKKQMVDLVKQRNARMDQEGYADAQKYGQQSYDDYLQNNRVDAYIRALVNPRLNPDWQKPGIFTPEMQAVGAQIKALLSAPRR